MIVTYNRVFQRVYGQIPKSQPDTPDIAPLKLCICFMYGKVCIAFLTFLSCLAIGPTLGCQRPRGSASHIFISQDPRSSIFNPMKALNHCPSGDRRTRDRAAQYVSSHRIASEEEAFRLEDEVLRTRQGFQSDHKTSNSGGRRGAPARYEYAKGPVLLPARPHPFFSSCASCCAADRGFGHAVRIWQEILT